MQGLREATVAYFMILHYTNKRIIGRVVICAFHVVSKERRRLVLPRTSCLFYVTFKMPDQNLWPCDKNHTKVLLPNAAGELLTLLRIREVPSSNLCLMTNPSKFFHGFPQSLQASAGTMLGQYHFLHILSIC
jgi:hypothetical protein